MIRWVAATVLVVALAIGGWFGYRALTAPDAPANASSTAIRVEQQVPEGAPPTGIETLDTNGTAGMVAGVTPMAERVAVIGLLNKRNGASRDVTLRPGGVVRIGDVVLRLRACDRTAPWEADQLTGAFVQMDVRGADRAWRRGFSGWLFKERPALNVVQHPIYDVWAKSCTMSFPATGPETEEVAPTMRSRRAKSPTPRAEEPATPSESAVSSNAI
jgi:hypothetical protein